MTRTRYRIFESDPGAPGFMTCTVVAWLPVFARPRLVEIVLESWRFLQRERDVSMFGYVIPSNLPRLATLRPPRGNSRPQGIATSYYERRKRSDLPQHY